MRKCIKKNKFIIIASATFLVLEYFICSKIYLMGDDYMYGTFAKEGILRSVADYYFTGNGRWLVNIFDSLILSFDRYFFIVITPLLLLLFAWLIYNIGSLITGKKNNNVFIISLLAVATMDIMMTRETVYWITGMANFLLPATLFLAAVKASLYIVKNENYSNGKKIFCGIICVIASATMEQFALMTVGWLFLLFGYKILERGRINKAELIIFALSVVALASVILAPGNFVRVEDAAETSQSFRDKLFDLFLTNFQSVTAAKFAIPLSLVEAVVLLKQERKKSGIIAILNTVIMLVVTVILGVENILIAGITFLIFAITSLFAVVSLRKQIKVFYVVVFVFLAIGSQIMLLVSDIFGYRTSFAVVTVYMVLTMIFCLLIDDKKKILLPIICIYAFYANVYFGIASAIITVIMLTTKEKIWNVLKYAVVIITIAWSLVNVGLGFNLNIEMHKFNEQQAKSVDTSTKELKIKTYDDENYGWCLPPLSEFHAEHFKKYHGIPDDVELVYEEKQN